MRSPTRSSRQRELCVILSILTFAVGVPESWSSPDHALVDDGTWESFRHPSTNHAAIYDPVRNRMVIFGGSSTNGASREVWVQSLTGTPTWTQLNPTGSPSVRIVRAGAAIYDPVRDRMIVFGWYETWALSFSGTPAWTQLATMGTVPVVDEHSAIYDPIRDRMLVFGGHAPSVESNKLYELTLSGTPTWTEIMPPNPIPVRRSGHTAIYDPVRDRMIVFSGYDGSGTYLNDVWALELSGSPTWVQLAPGGGPPNGRSGHTAIYDPASDRMIVFGGGLYPYFGDTWELSLAGATWTQLSPSGSAPSSRTGHTAVYDSKAARMIVYGGGSYSTKTYSYSFALDLAGGTSWAPLGPGSDFPIFRADHAAVYDPVGRRMIVFGGMCYDCNATASGSGDTWVLPLTGEPIWAQMEPSGTPPSPRYGHSAIWDPVRRRIIVFGGRDDFAYHNDLWELSLTGTPTWTQLSPLGGPPAERAHNWAIYDPSRDRMIVYGGNTNSLYYGDLWELSLAGTPTWTPLVPAGTAPSPRASAAAIYDPVRDRVIMFSGHNINDELWQLSLSGMPTWTQLVPSGSSAGRAETRAIYDAQRDRMVIFGGRYQDRFGFNFTLSSVLSLQLSGAPQWTFHQPSGVVPAARRSTILILDRINDRMVTFGGNPSALTFDFQGDTHFLEWGNPIVGPDIEVAPQVLHYQAVAVGSSMTRIVVVSNYGTADLHVSDIVSSDPSLTPNETSFTLVPAESRNIVVEWAPSAVETLSATLTISSDDADSPSRMVTVTGTVDLVGAPQPAAVTQFALRLASPNPARGGAHLELAVPERATVNVNVYDIRGGLVMLLARREFVPGRHPIQWDGTDAGGRRVRAGIYFIQASTRGDKSSLRVVLVP